MKGLSREALKKSICRISPPILHIYGSIRKIYFAKIKYITQGYKFQELAQNAVTSQRRQLYDKIYRIIPITTKENRYQ